MVQASLKKQLRNLSQISWMSWNDAASYLLAEKVGLAEALKYADKSIENEDRYDNEITKSRVLSALNRKEEAATAQKKALDLARSTPDPLLCSSAAEREAQRRSVRDLFRKRSKTPRPIVRVFGVGSDVFCAG